MLTTQIIKPYLEFAFYKEDGTIDLIFKNGFTGTTNKDWSCIDYLEDWIHIDTIEDFNKYMVQNPLTTLKEIKKVNKEFDLEFFKKLYRL